MNLPYSEELNIETLGRLFDNKAECYKLFWFQAIMTKVSLGQDTMSFDELINEMIADAWYMVTEYHLNLGPNDTLEKVVNHIKGTTDFGPTVKKDTILNYLALADDREVRRFKKTLSNEVPYRLQAPFLDTAGFKWQEGSARRAAAINAQRDRLMYYFAAINGLESRIQMSADWMNYLTRNQEVIHGWIRFNMITYLQRRNPSVPGISDKLEPQQERKLDRVKKYWKVVTELTPIYDIYGHNDMSEKAISIDHFVPWSYVAHDELWNLHPTTRSVNSSKSNNLPSWDAYFVPLAAVEYRAYKLMWQYEAVMKAFNDCSKEHLNNAEIKYQLYREGLSEDEFRSSLGEVIAPVYHAAENCGFRTWRYEV